VSRPFTSHSSADNTEATAICGWLADQGWDDVFLDMNPKRVLVAGQCWQTAFREAWGPIAAAEAEPAAAHAVVSR
jgi:hypothetical protein